VAAVIVAAHSTDLDAEENMAMTNEAYKAWLDAMPIDDMHDSIERLEQELSDLRALEQLHAQRQARREAAPETAEPEASSEQETPSEPHSDVDRTPTGPDEPT
jgi:hypothetical protein